MVGQQPSLRGMPPHFINIVEPRPNTGSAKTDRHRAIDTVLANATSDYRAPLSGGACVELLIGGKLQMLRQTWIEDVHAQFGATEP